MATITIAFDADVIEATVAEKTFQAALADMPNESLRRIFAYGFQRIVNDRTGGKDKDAAAKHKIATDMIERIMSGEIAQRATTAGEPAINRYIRAVVRKALGEATKAKYDAIPSDDQSARAEFLMSTYTAASDDVRKRIDAAAEQAMEADRKAKEAARKAGNELSL